MIALHITCSLNDPGEKYEVKEVRIYRKYIPRKGDFLEVGKEIFKVKSVTYTENSFVKLRCQLM